MQHQVNEAPIDAKVEQLQGSRATEATRIKRDAAALWRALAGMAISLALACLIVMLEFTGQAAHQADRMHRHAEALLSRVLRLESQVATARARIATAHRELAAGQALRALLRAPDLKRVPLTGAGRALLAFSVTSRSAVLQVDGLAPPPTMDKAFVLWWTFAQGPPVKAAEFRTAADGSALVTAALPPGLNVTAAMVTAEQAANGGAADAAQASAPTSAQTGPAGPVQLRGTLTP